MKARVTRIRSISKVQRNETVRAEMQTFVAALASYPDRFAANPRISFSEHLYSLMIPVQDGTPLQNPGRARVLFSCSAKES
jgi:hypothetical protein